MRKQTNKKTNPTVILICGLLVAGTVAGGFGLKVYNQQQTIKQEAQAIQETNTFEPEVFIQEEIPQEVVEQQEQATNQKLETAQTGKTISTNNNLSSLLESSNIDYEMMLESFDKVYEQKVNYLDIIEDNYKLEENEPYSITGFGEVLNSKEGYKELGLSAEQYEKLQKNGFFVKMVSDLNLKKDKHEVFYLYYNISFAKDNSVYETLSNSEKSIYFDSILKTYDQMQKKAIPIYTVCNDNKSTPNFKTGHILVTFNN